MLSIIANWTIQKADWIDSAITKEFLRVLEKVGLEQNMNI